MSLPGDAGGQLSALPQRSPLFRRRHFLIRQQLAEDDPPPIGRIVVIRIVVGVATGAAANQEAALQIGRIGLVRWLQSIRRSAERDRLAEAAQML